MKLAIMQPYFFPYLGYIDLIRQAEEWIVFDTAQYIRHGWVNRNRVLHPKEGWLYVVVPVQKQPQSTPISETVIVNDGGRWRRKIIGQLQHYRKHAPFFQETMSLVKKGISSGKTSIAQLDIDCVSLVCEYLGIGFHYRYFCDMDLELGPIDGPGDWALRISEAVGATEYINAPGGADLFDRSKFEDAGIQLTIQKPVDFVYDCHGYDFQPRLSIIDVMMWNSPQSIRDYLISRQQEEAS